MKSCQSLKIDDYIYIRYSSIFDTLLMYFILTFHSETRKCCVDYFFTNSPSGMPYRNLKIEGISFSGNLSNFQTEHRNLRKCTYTQ